MSENESTGKTQTDKKFYKKPWFWAVIVVLLIICAVGPKNSSKPITNSTESSSNATQAVAQAEPAEPSVPAEYKSALAKATDYANTMNMSKQGVYDQLTSDYGEKFSAAAAQYAIENVKADWNANALAKAKDYQSQENMSPAAIHDQLTSSYGEKFTQAEADYAIQHLND